MTLTEMLASAIAESNGLNGHFGSKASLRKKLASDSNFLAEAKTILNAADPRILQKDHITRVRVQILKEVMPDGN